MKNQEKYLYTRILYNITDTLRNMEAVVRR